MMASLPDLVAAFQEGRYADVARVATARLEDSTADEMVLSLLGNSLLELKRPQEAAEVYRTAIRQFPGVALHWNNLGTALRNNGQLRDAEMAYAEALRLEPYNAGYLANLGFLHMQLGNVAKAQEYLWEAFNCDPQNLEARIYGAQMSMECGEDSCAHTMLDDWRRWVHGLTPQLTVELGSLLIRLGSSADGELLLRRYLDDPVYGQAARVRLVVVLERLNRLDEARALLVSLPAHENVTDPTLRGEIVEAEAIIAMRDKDLSVARALIERRLGEMDVERWRASALFMLASICDKQGEYSACADYLAKAHASQVTLLKQLVPELLQPDATPLRIANSRVTLEQFRRWSHDDNTPPKVACPVFVLGFPRSGTTMLEQMLDAHPHMQSMDERAFLQDVVEVMQQQFGLSYPEQLGDLTSGQMAALRETYWAAVAKVVTLGPSQRLVDKNPLNMLRLPMIARLFPDSPVIFVVRHPCDVTLSCYMQQFRSPGFAAMCASLPSLARGYANAMCFWFHHVDLLRPRVMEWHYENVVHDFDIQVTKLGTFLGLADTKPLHDFSEHAKRKGYIATPSYSQVVRPVYADSIGHWQHYREHFAPVLHEFEAALLRWRYRA